MQSPVGGTMPPMMMKWYRTRTVLSGLSLAALAVLYFPLVYPIAIAEVPPSDYRFSFFIIAVIYAIDLGILSIEWLYKVIRPPRAIPQGGPVGRLGTLGIVLRIALVLMVGGSYVTGAAVATPTVFTIPPLQALTAGGTMVILADYLHALFATLIIGFGAAVVVFEVAKVAAHKQTFKDWLVKARYPEIKLFYWAFGITLIAQGIIGLFLLGTISPVGPFGLLGNNSYGLEDLLRHIHGPLGAVVFVLFTNLIYLRLRPEFRIR